jgi:hypothetical protein
MFFTGPEFVLQVHGMRGRRGGGELVDDLPMAIAIERHAERTKTGNYSPQLDAVAQEGRDRRSLALCSRERVLETMNLMSMLRRPNCALRLRRTIGIGPHTPPCYFD